MLISSRRVISGIEWVKTLKGNGKEVGKMVEKGKSAFAGPEIKGKTIGVVGLGAIGVMVANAANALGMTVYGYDPYLSVKSAWNLTHNAVHIYDINRVEPYPQRGSYLRYKRDIREMRLYNRSCSAYGRYKRSYK